MIERAEDEEGAHPVDVELGVRRDTGAHAGNILSLADTLQAALAGLWRRLVGHRFALGFDRADLVQHAVDVTNRDDPIVSPEMLDQPVTDRLLQVAQDLGSLGDLEARPSAVEVAAQVLVGILVKLETLGVSTQPDVDRRVHLKSPVW